LKRKSTKIVKNVDYLPEIYENRRNFLNFQKEIDENRENFYYTGC